MPKAIVNSGSRKLLGEAPAGAEPGHIVMILRAYELRNDMFLLQAPQGLAAIAKSAVVPLDAEEDAVNIYVKIDNIRWFDDMEDKGRKYDLMISEAENNIMMNRAGRAGLQVARNVPGPETGPKPKIVL